MELQEKGRTRLPLWALAVKNKATSFHKNQINSSCVILFKSKIESTWGVGYLDQMSHQD